MAASLLEKLSQVQLEVKAAASDFQFSVDGKLRLIEQKKLRDATSRVEAALRVARDAVMVQPELTLQWVGSFLLPYKSTLADAEYKVLKTVLIDAFKVACLEQEAITLQEFNQKI